MIAAEIKNSQSTVRIHDEFCEPFPQVQLTELSKIVSRSYLRRNLDAETLSHKEKPQ